MRNSTPANRRRARRGDVRIRGDSTSTMSRENLRWKKDFWGLGLGLLPGARGSVGVFGSSPVIHDGMVIIQADVQERILSRRIRRGKRAKSYGRLRRTDVPTWSSPVVHVGFRGSPQVVVNGFRHMGGYDLATGEEIWRMAGGGDIPVPTPVVLGGSGVF